MYFLCGPHGGFLYQSPKESRKEIRRLKDANPTAELHVVRMHELNDRNVYNEM